MKLYEWNVSVQMERFFFMFFLCLSFLLLASYYYAMIAHKTMYIVNFFAIIFSTKLFYMMADVEDHVLKKQIVQLMSIGVFILVISFLPVPFWIVVTVNNFFALVYFGFMYLHQRKSRQKYRFIQSYVSLVHLFYIIYLISLNLQVLFIQYAENAIYVLLNYLQVGLQSVLLVLSMVSYLFYSRTLRLRKINSFFDLGHHLANQENKQKPSLMIRKETLISDEVKIKHQEVMEQILEFFETHTDYLKSDFTLELLGKSISISNLNLISFVINNHLNTTFYKLVAYYRILYALQLFALRQDWTLIAIAESVGFKSVNTFNKYFKDLTGLSPIAYRVSLEKKRA